MKDEFAWLDAVGQAELVRRGEVTPLELVDAAIQRIERQNGALRAVILPTFDRARERARELASDRRALATLPFGGVPFLMKDLGGEEAGVPCHRGMRVLKEANWIEPRDSYLSQRIRASGLISLGRTNTPELGLLPTSEPLAYGATANPWYHAYSAGGSSGGSAAAVAAGFVAMAHASDGGGSIRIPAAHCGLVGLKPTRARCSFGPFAGERWGGYSCELVVSRSVRDTATFLDIANGPMPGDPYYAAPPLQTYGNVLRSAPPRLRIGVLAQLNRSDLNLHSDCVRAVEKARGVLSELGHQVEESNPDALGDAEAVRSFVTVVGAQTARALDVWSERLGRPIGADDVEPLTWAVADIGRTRSVTDYIAAIDYGHALGRRMASWWEEGFDLLLTPTTAQPAPVLGELVSPPDDPLLAYFRAAPYGAFTSVFNQTGQPAISLPVHTTPGGIPVGAQLVAAYGREDLLLQVAAQIEEACGWKEKHPRI